MARVAVFHKIGTEGEYTNTIEDILAFDGVITFDGIYRSVYENREQLLGKDIILFYTGDPQVSGTLSKKETIDLAHYLRAEIGWHTYLHHDLTQLSDEELRIELQSPLDLPPMQTLAYPFGNFDDRVIQFAKEAGFKRAFSTTQGNDDRFALKRVYI